MQNQRKFKAVKENTEGDFYVEDGCCTMCGVPHAEAPEHFGGFDEKGEVTHDQCFVKKQPQTPQEEQLMVNAMAAQEMLCIRYCGSKKEILQKLVEAGEETQIDHLDKNAIQHESKSNSLWQQFINFIKP